MKPLTKKRSIKKGATAAALPDERVLPVVAALDEASAILSQEADLLAGGKPMEIEQFVEQKRQAELRIARAGREAAAAGLVIEKGSVEGQLVEAAVLRLHSAAMGNAEALQGAHDAIAKVSDTLKRAASTRGSEGMYSRTAGSVSSRDKTVIGFGTAI